MQRRISENITGNYSKGYSSVLSSIPCDKSNSSDLLVEALG